MSDMELEQAEQNEPALVAEHPTDLGKVPDAGLKGQPYQYEVCTIGVTFALLPDDGTGNRPVLVTVRSHEDLPAAMKLYRMSDLVDADGQAFGKSPQVLAEMLEAMKDALLKRAATQKPTTQRKTITIETKAQSAVPSAAPAAPETKTAGQLGLF